MPNPKIILSDADLHSPQVEDKLKQQAAVESAQASYRDASNRPSRLAVPDDEGGSFWYNTIVNMTIFGLIGGVLAFGLGETIRYFHPDLRAKAKAFAAELGKRYAAKTGITPEIHICRASDGAHRLP